MEQTKEEEFWNTLTHFIGLILSLGGLPVLFYYDQSQTALSSYSILFFGIGLILLYAASTAYHFTSNFKLKEKFRVLDHISVFYLIAGSYAPVCLITLYEGKGVSLFLAIIIITLLGTAFKVFYTGKFEKLSLLIYLAMGWLIILDFNTVLALIEFKGILLMIVGGLLYSIGTICYLACVCYGREHFTLFSCFVLCDIGCFNSRKTGGLTRGTLYSVTKETPLYQYD